MSRQAHGAVCRCGRAILVGDDADRCALQARVDVFPLSRVGELLAVLDGRATYEHDHRGHLHRRDRWQLRSPAKEPVLASHDCTGIPDAWRMPPPPPASRPRPEEF